MQTNQLQGPEEREKKEERWKLREHTLPLQERGDQVQLKQGHQTIRI